MVFSAIAVNNMLWNLKSVNSSRIKAIRISFKHVGAKHIMSGQVPCPACFHLAASQLLHTGEPTPPLPAYPRFTCSEDMTLSPFYSYWAFLEHECKEAYHSRLGKLPGFTSMTQKALKSQITGMAQGDTVEWFLVFMAHVGVLMSSFTQVTVNSIRPTLIRHFGQVKSKVNKLWENVKRGKKGCCGACAFQWGAQPGLLSLHGETVFAMFSCSHTAKSRGVFEQH